MQKEIANQKIRSIMRLKSQITLHGSFRANGSEELVNYTEKNNKLHGHLNNNKTVPKRIFSHCNFVLINVYLCL